MVELAGDGDSLTVERAEVPVGGGASGRDDDVIDAEIIE
jgi:hypothetical protein